MDRIIVYPGSIPLDTDVLNTNRNVMTALGALMAATLGTAPVIDGLDVQPTSPASMNVQVAAGCITSYGLLDAAAYGTLGFDISDALVKMGVNTAPALLGLATPPVAGTSVTYLIQAAFAETDVNATVLPYYNPANPAVPWLGAAGAGAAQPTLRAQRVLLEAKAGAANLSGSQVPPPPDAGFVGLAIVTVTSGASTVLASAIVPLSTRPALAFKLRELRPGFSNAQVFAATGIFTVPPGVTRAKVTVIGGGGAGGLHQTLASGGGGAGGRGTLWFSGFVPGAQVPVTLGTGGVAPGGGGYGQGGSGGTSSFGTLVSATGGQGGAGGTSNASAGGGAGGGAFGGAVNENGSYGTDAIMLTGRGGDGGGPGSGRGSSQLAPGIGGQGPGGGGGGGGATTSGGSGAGAPGGNGADGIVIVEF